MLVSMVGDISEGMLCHYPCHCALFFQVDDDTFIGTIEEIISKITETKIADLIMGIICVAILICMRVRGIFPRNCLEITSFKFRAMFIFCSNYYLP